MVSEPTDAILRFLRDYTVDATVRALAIKRRECLRGPALTRVFDSDMPQIATLPGDSTSMLLRPGVVKRHVDQPLGKLRRFLDAGPPPVQTQGTGLVRQRATGMGALSNVLFFTGCSGTGKSHILRELAGRAIGASASIRVATIDDCRSWAALDAWAQVSYLASAIGQGFSTDESFGASAFHALTVASMTSASMLALQVVDTVARYCKASGVRVLFCVDGYSDTLGTVVCDVVQGVAQRSDVFFVALATTANEYVVRFANAATRVPPRYSDAEARVMLDYYVASAFDESARARLASCAYAPMVHRLVAQATAFHPGDMALLFKRTGGAADFDDFCRRSAGFATDYADLEAAGDVWSGPGRLRRTCLHPELSESADRSADAVFRLFFKLPVNASDVTAVENGSSLHPEYNAHFQLFAADERGRGSPSELEFVSPRRGNFVFDRAARDLCLFRAAGRRLGLGGRGRYEMAYACVLWMLRREGLSFLAARGATLDSRLFGAAPETRHAICADISQRFAPPGVSTVGYYTAGFGSPMRGLDFVTFRRADSSSPGLASFVLAMACDADDVASVMENCAYRMTVDGCFSDGMLLTPEETAFAGISEACRVAEHLGRPGSTVFLAVSEGVFRNSPTKVAALPGGPLAPRLELVSIKTVLKNSAVLPVHELAQLG
ncbi:hypothetical protein GGI20_001018 [Coemansia sp. BCRC 34301]|nr:hypothetical protein GGI20_001018 [Coemansia sp. BCRC 34301]